MFIWIEQLGAQASDFRVRDLIEMNYPLRKMIHITQDV